MSERFFSSFVSFLNLKLVRIHTQVNPLPVSWASCSSICLTGPAMLSTLRMLRMLRVLWEPVNWTRLHKTGEALPLLHTWWSGHWHWEICVQFLSPHKWDELHYGLLREACQPQATGYSVGRCWTYFGNAVGHHNSISLVFSLPCFAAELPPSTRHFTARA